MSKPLVAFPWYGGKYYLRDRLYKHFPRDCKHYAEVFGGSAVLLLNLDPPFPIETYNDINSNVVNFFRVLREHTDELIFALELTPYSIEEYKSATPDHPDPIERARRFYICVRQGWNGIADNKATWRFNKVKSGGHTSLQWLNSFNKLWTVAKRLQFAQIENQDAIRFIDKYDTPQTFFYCDPPYVHDSRVAPEAYEYEMTNEQHIALGNRLNNIEGKAMVSGFHSKLYDELFAGWECKEFKTTKYSARRSRVDGEIQTRDQNTEVIWTNYPLEQKGRLL